MDDIEMFSAKASKLTVDTTKPSSEQFVYDFTQEFSGSDTKVKTSQFDSLPKPVLERKLSLNEWLEEIVEKGRADAAAEVLHSFGILGLSDIRMLSASYDSLNKSKIQDLFARSDNLSKQDIESIVRAIDNLIL